MNRKIPIGVSDFKEIIEENYYYVDKSLFIKEIIDDGSEVILLPRPRRFGKTLNMSMLRYFFEKGAHDTSYLFTNLKIWEIEEYRQYRGKYPVIYVTFKDSKCDTWETCYDHFKYIIGEEFLKHQYLLEGNALNEIEKKRFNEISNNQSNRANLERSLKILTEYLYKYHKQKVIVLIDEYDIPIQSGHTNKYFKEVISFIRSLLCGVLKDNTCLQTGVLTGILRVAKESIFSGLNNPTVRTLLDYDYSDKFGLLEQEVLSLIKEIGLESQIDMSEIEKWYNGYIFGKNAVYNPWSIINYLKYHTEGCKPYWVNTSDNAIVRSILSKGGESLKQDLEDLICGKSLYKKIDDSIAMGEIENNTDTVWSFLLFSGYLKAKDRKMTDIGIYYTLQIPNKEVLYLYKEIILNWFNTSITENNLDIMLKSLITGDIKKFSKILKDFVVKSMSFFDTGGTEPEKVYHAFVLGLLLKLNDRYQIRSNRESGYGRYDVMLIPRDLNNNGIVMEFKTVDEDENEDLEKAAQEALKQIEEKQYRVELKDAGVKSIYELGISFKGKEVLVKEKHIV